MADEKIVESIAVHAVCVGLAVSWKFARTDRAWNELGDQFQGAMLAMIGAGREEDVKDFKFLRDLARQRQRDAA